MGEEKSNSEKRKSHIKKTLKYNSKNQDKMPNEGDTLAQPVPDASDTTGTVGTTNNFDVASLADKAVNINILKYEVDRLPLDFKARAYFENDVRPLVDTLYTLSLASIDYSTAAKNLAGINFGHTSQIKDAIDLTDEINEISEDLVKVLRCKIDNMLNLSKYDCKCK
ncbi:hypothetical protein K9O30_17305 [Clostridium bowmanii]|uniref:hypothetical protein n=1 Tax=Clostridium bowmanii TaxID=132925 RepID=UPI001C0DA5FC|nr:hypothetical protein [Clostridium bowmanii]MBU3190935.1 hypothetical protein [Clostridium bowmanii]MCA1075446.1 hypothetical protein [Clostridium bowmanii]